MRLRKICLNIFLLGLFFLSGCVSTTEYQTSSLGRGVYHKVRPGETLWRIAKTYNVSIDDIIKHNQIPNVTHIEKDQLIFIPGAASRKEISIDSVDSYKSNGFDWPVKGKIVSYFGDHKGLWVNKGIDLQIDGETAVVASRAGEVVLADDINGYAKTVILGHADGYFTVYSRNHSLLVKVGDSVAKGASIARIGKNNESSLLHFEVRKNDTADNPLYYLP